MTNYDKIKNMSIDEMTEFFTKFGDYCGNQCTYCPEKCLDGTCKKRIKQWLQQEAKPILSEAERVILENIDKEYKWIARDKDKKLFIYRDKPSKNTRFEEWLVDGKSENMSIVRHLFQFITWQDDEPYNIEELLKN